MIHGGSRAPRALSRSLSLCRRCYIRRLQLVTRVRDDELVALFVTPSLLAAALGASDENVFMAAFARVRVVWLTGENVRGDMVARFARAAPHCALRNVYSTNESGDLAVCELLRGAEAAGDLAASRSAS